MNRITMNDRGRRGSRMWQLSPSDDARCPEPCRNPALLGRAGTDSRRTPPTLPGNVPLYVLMTAAHNEEKYIAQTIESILAQSVQPFRWVIVSDNSSDRTDAIVSDYARKADFITLLRVAREPGRDFGSKGKALRAGYQLLKSNDFQFIGNVDADITVDANYFSELMTRCGNDANLGIVGGVIVELQAGKFRERAFNSECSVAHAAQLVRRSCFDEIGGYAVLKCGGEDWHAQISASMRGWAVKSFRELPIYHHRPTGTGESNFVRGQFNEGRADYLLGSDPVFEIAKCARRVGGVRGASGLYRLAGFCWSALKRESRPVDSEFIAFLRKDQRDRVKRLIIPFGKSSQLSAGIH